MGVPKLDRPFEVSSKNSTAIRLESPEGAPANVALQRETMRSNPDTKLHEMFDHVRKAICILEDLMCRPAAATTASTSAQMKVRQDPRPERTSLNRLAYSIKEVCQLAAVGRSTLYAEIGEGRLRAVKHGRRTLILTADLQDWIAKWPASRSASSTQARNEV